MKFIPHNNTVLLKRVSEKEQMKDDGGILLKKSYVDLYKVIALSPVNESKTSWIEPGDIVTVCAIGTDLIDESGNEFVLMNMDYITGKLI